MREGSIFAVIEFPDSWPFSFRVIIFREVVNDSIICIYGNQEAQIEIQVDDVTFISQSIIFTLAKRCLLSILWNFAGEPKIKCFINSIKLESADSREIFYVQSNPDLNDINKSFDHEQASALCESWVSWRCERYGSLKVNPKKARIIKSIDQQVQELHDSLISLDHYISHFRNQERLFLINVLPHLRSLLFWRDKGAKNYNPLLFRIAGYLKLALPVFAFKDEIRNELGNELFSDALVHRVHNYPSITKKYINQEIIDFQEWLAMEIIVDRANQDQQTYRWKDILFESANTVSAAHFDDDIPVLIDNLRESISWNKSVFYSYIITITEITLTLGNHVIAKANQ